MKNDKIESQNQYITSVHVIRDGKRKVIDVKDKSHIFIMVDFEEADIEYNKNRKKNETEKATMQYIYKIKDEHTTHMSNEAFMMANAVKLMKKLGIPFEEAVKIHFEDLDDLRNRYNIR